MKDEIADEWITRLTSGVYHKGSGHLCKDGTHCALGVLCEIAVERGVCDRRGWKGQADVFDGEYQMNLPPKVVEWAGMKGQDGRFRDEELAMRRYDMTSVMGINDASPRTFPEIALIIDKERNNL